MSKLIKPAGFNRPVGKMIQLPYPDAMLAGQITVMLLANGRIELYGMVDKEAMAVKLLELGIERLKQWHAKKRDDEAKAKKAQEEFLGGQAPSPIIH